MIGLILHCQNLVAVLYMWVVMIAAAPPPSGHTCLGQVQSIVNLEPPPPSVPSAPFRLFCLSVSSVPSVRPVCLFRSSLVSLSQPNAHPSHSPYVLTSR